MNKLTVNIVLALIVVCSLAAQPKIEVVKGETVDFGELYKGEKIQREISLKNIGDQTLVISNVQASCGCTATLLSEKVIQPNKVATLSVGFDSKGFWGPVQKTVTVFSNDPLAPSKLIRFTAHIKEVIAATPPYVYFPPAKIDSSTTASTVLKNLSDDPVTITAITSDIPSLKFDLRDKTILPGQTTQLHVTFTPTSPGYISSDVVIKTNHPKQPQVSLKLICNVLRPTGKVQP